ncbi:anti-phage defense-associated sirtuin Dsr1 [Cupriavidus pauculus]|uniref:anti-phage defense-associated sirtuin Dsr1 n=1 Tax=Cupriavidus pauculus TaxID=82633 RepID=UPI001FD40219|nr:anti-phage defense-associated sirtuin Dsr1 [Cupriavidus pauculus]
MQFVKDGPDIPETLLQAHEDGKVVFFCGAGISYPAGLPGFGGLVEQLYEELGETPNGVQAAALKAFQYDTAVGLLEESIGSRETVRRKLSAILSPDLTSKDATATHEALLTLAKTKHGATRLITTNFDRLFQHVIVRDGRNVDHFCAPLLPVPKSRWNGIVYVHGLLPESPTAQELDRLVISSGDFGLAYLTERWASRFVGELFRNYVVCFVGYSLNDPVLRYMTDALAADRLRGEAPPEMFAFGSYKRNQQERIEQEWRAKNVTPILYKDTKGHPYLHRTIRSWAGTYNDGVRGKERIVVDCVRAGPGGSTKQDDFVGRLLWAISDPNGSAARQFAEHVPAPPLEWLEHFGDERYKHRDLRRFGVEPARTVDTKLKFSVACRPTPYMLAPWMALVHNGHEGRRLDAVMAYIAQWLALHLNDPELVLWIVEHGGHLTEDFAFVVTKQLNETAKLQRSGNAQEIQRQMDRAPNSLPGVAMRTLWRLLLSGRVKSQANRFDIFRWREQFQRDGFTTSTRLELRELLSPRVALRRPFARVGDTPPRTSPEEQLKYLVDWDVVLAADFVDDALRELAQSQEWRTALPRILEDMYSALRDVLDVMRELGEASDASDLGMWHMPSISPHWQNRRYHDWTILIELVRDAWLATHEAQPNRARQIAQSFMHESYPTFVRLGLYAATQAGVAEPGEWVDWIVANNGQWLWSSETQREVMRLLYLRSSQLHGEALNRLESAIQAGPPRDLYREDLEPDMWRETVDWMVWLRLAKLRAGGANLTASAIERLDGIQTDHSAWELTSNEREEFPHWMSGTGDPDYKLVRQIERAPRQRRLLMTWLLKAPEVSFFKGDDWTELCRERFATAVVALYALSLQNEWPETRWREALQVWSDGPLVSRSWRYIAPTVSRMPDHILKESASAVTFWLREASKDLKRHEDVLFHICERYLDIIEDAPVDDKDPLFHAINHPIGHVTEALIRWWFSGNPEDDQKIPVKLQRILHRLCDTSIEIYRHARIILCQNVIALMRVDPDWASANVLPLFNWDASEAEARSAWIGYLWAPRLYRPLLAALKISFLDTAFRYERLGEVGPQYASVLTFSALDATDLFNQIELQTATRKMPIEGLEQAALALVQALSSAGERRSEYWTHRVRPYIEKIWPKAVTKNSDKVAMQFARVALAAGDKFPDAFSFLKTWMRPIPYPYTIIQEAIQNEVCSRFPQEALAFLALIVDGNTVPPPELQSCLDTVAKAEPSLAQSRDFRSLEDCIRRFRS